MTVRWLVFLVGLFLSASSVSAPVHVAENGYAEIRLDDLELLEDKSARLSLDDIIGKPGTRPRHSLHFTKATAESLHPGFSRSAFWLRLEVANQTDAFQSLRLALSSPRLQNVDFYVRRGLNANSTWTHSIAGAARPLSVHTNPGRQPLLSLGLASRESVLILVRVASESSIKIVPNLYSSNAFRAVINGRSIVDGMLIGALLMLSAYSLMVCILSPSMAMVWQTFGFGLLALYEAAYRGLAKTYLWPESVFFGFRSQGLLGSIVVMVLVFYLFSVIGKLNREIRGRNVLAVLVFMQIGCVIGMVVGDYYVFAQASLFFAPLVVAALCFMSFWYRGDERKWVVVALFLTFASVCLKTIELMAVLPRLSLPGNTYALGFLCAIVALVALAIGGNRLALKRQLADKRLIELQSTQQYHLKHEIARQTLVLNQALAKSRETSREQGRIMTYIGHDLRAPLATIVGYARLLHNVVNPNYAWYAHAIERGADYQLALIDDLLEYASPSLKPLSIDPAPLHLQRLLDDIEGAAAALADRQNNRFIFERGAELPTWVRMDGKRMQQVLINLLSNAAKFTSDGTISLALTARPFGKNWKLRFEVADTGIGIAEEDRLRIFERFEQARHSAGGLGLGLFIARRIVEGMGGVLGLVSAPGLGSRFFFEVQVPVEEASMFEAYEPRARGNQQGGAGEAARPPPEALRELAQLAEQGEWSAIEDWIDRVAASRPDCREYVYEVQTALRALDFGCIARLARPSDEHSPNSR